MIIAVEKKSGAKLTGSYSEESIRSFELSFTNELFKERYGEPDIEISNAVQVLRKRLGSRKAIAKQAGDTDSLLGTTSDAVQLLLHAFSRMTVALNSANTLAEVRSATKDFFPIAERLVANVDSGDTRLSFQVKGVDEVVSEVEQRMTTVTQVLEGAQ